MRTKRLQALIWWMQLLEIAGGSPTFLFPMLYSSDLSFQYNQTGKFIIGMIAPLYTCIFEVILFNEHPRMTCPDGLMTRTKYFQHILSLEFAVKEINNNHNLLQNLSLGFQIYDSYASARMTTENTLKLLSRKKAMIPNFKYSKKEHLIAVIGGLESEISFYVATVLGIYKVPQIAYCVVAPVKDAKMMFPSFYRMVPNEEHQYGGIVQLLRHFQWTWVGILAMDDDNGDTFVQILMPMLLKHGICTAINGKIPDVSHVIDTLSSLEDIPRKASYLSNANVKVLIVNAENPTMTCLLWTIYLYTTVKGIKETSLDKIWIITAQWDFSSDTMLRAFDIQVFHGSLTFSIHSNTLPEFRKFLLRQHPNLEGNNDFIRLFWQEAFNCSFSDFEHMESMSTCTGQEKLDSLLGTLFEMSMTGQSYSIYNAVHSIAHVLQKMLASRLNLKASSDRHRLDVSRFQPSQLLPYLKSLLFNNTVGDTVSFNGDGELVGGFDIVNWITFPNQSFSRVKVGFMDPQAAPGQELSINEESITWHSSFNKKLPLAKCNENCYPGYSKKKKEGEPFCCYDCIPCPGGTISDTKDIDDCFLCPEYQFANKKREKCLDKILNFLAFTDHLGMTLTFLILFFTLITISVLGIFIKYRNTPIVKANNRNLTYFLLISLLLCFLCSLLFIGKPGSVICYLRQTSFAVVFSIAVSSILAKTITVILAFKATKPGSKIRKWVGKKLTSSVIFGGVSFQVSICALWLGTIPPSLDLDTHTLSEEIIVECNEGSVSMFYCVLGYLGFLAIVSFIVASQARKLPNSFNETKFITFSMLVFCSVWMSFIPAYFSTKGKYMVAVEIFSILASSAGLLGCIFGPKCYIIILKPSLNSKDQLIRRKM